MIITAEQFNVVFEFAVEHAEVRDEDAKMVRWYSGRGMYGSECVGFVGTFAEYTQWLLSVSELWALQGLDLDDLQYAMRDARMDGMGVGNFVFYFPGLRKERNLPQPETV